MKPIAEILNLVRERLKLLEGKVKPDSQAFHDQETISHLLSALESSLSSIYRMEMKAQQIGTRFIVVARMGREARLDVERILNL